MNAEPVLEPVQNIADNRACRACDNANGCWHFRNFLFAILIKQAFTRQHPAADLQAVSAMHLHQQFRSG
jgi:hypothetical protein